MFVVRILLQRRFVRGPARSRRSAFGLDTQV